VTPKDREFVEECRKDEAWLPRPMARLLALLDAAEERAGKAEEALLTERLRLAEWCVKHGYGRTLDDVEAELRKEFGP